MWITRDFKIFLAIQSRFRGFFDRGGVYVVKFLGSKRVKLEKSAVEWL